MGAWRQTRRGSGQRHGTGQPGTWRREAPGAPAAAVLLLALALGACQSAQVTPDQTWRTVTETAPADLQLLCANAAAQSAGADPGSALPLSSRRLDAGSYQVDINIGGRTMGCIVDDDGNILSVEAA